MTELIGILGLGRMGLPIAEHLLAAGYTVHGFDPIVGARAAAADRGVTIVDNEAALAASSTILVSLVGGPDQLRDALAGPAGALATLRPGTVWLDLTSNDPRLATTLAAEVTSRGGVAVAAPMAGGPAAAAETRLAFTVAGDSAGRDRVAPVLEALARDSATRIHLLGEDVAHAHTAKLLANLLWFGQVVAVTEALLLGQARGLNPATLRELLAESAGASSFLENDASALLVGDDYATFGIDRVLEQLQILGELSAETRTPFELSAAVTRVYADTVDSFGPVAGELLAARLLEERAGRRLAE
ncbi:MAG TPA: NAD(P)-binding domain-containing protein [Pseudolysinimonas sp.]|nr:NAD(P)-binding domain-containing protein [Pseudolysinimonas sp.]